MKKKIIFNNISNITTIFFLLIIFFPLTNGIFHFSEASGELTGDGEKQEIKRPEFNLNSVFPFFGKYESFYNKSFVFREFLIRNFNNLKFNLFNISPVGSVLIGKTGWLFLAEENGTNFLEYYFHLKYITKSNLETRKRWLLDRGKQAEAMGCKYYYVVVPNKQSIYPELMPPGLDKPPSNSMLDKILGYLDGEGIDFIFDIRDIFSIKKEKKVLYQKTDTHWNQYGAFVAYRFIVKSICESSGFDVKFVSLDEFNIVENIRTGGDLLRMMSIKDGVFNNNMVDLREKNVSRNPKLPPMLLIHDSFGEDFKKFIPYDFKEYYYTTERNINSLADLIKQNKIKLIIEEIAERNFLKM